MALCDIIENFMTQLVGGKQSPKFSRWLYANNGNNGRAVRVYRAVPRSRSNRQLYASSKSHTLPATGFTGTSKSAF